MQNDPGENINLVDNPDYAEECERHRKLIKDWCKTVKTGQFKNLRTS